MSLPAHRISLDRLRERIRRIEVPRSYGILPFDIAEIDGSLPGGGLPLGAPHEVPGAEADEEDSAATAGFIAAILAPLGTGPGSAAAPQTLLCRKGRRQGRPESHSRVLDPPLPPRLADRNGNT
jgi:hypothetical protein